MSAELHMLGWVVMDRQTGKPISTGPRARQITKLYSKAGAARRVASYVGGPEWPEKYAAVSVWVDGEWREQ